jgi:hypothetical protein
MEVEVASARRALLSDATICIPDATICYLHPVCQHPAAFTALSRDATGGWISGMQFALSCRDAPVGLVDRDRHGRRARDAVHAQSAQNNHQ